MLPIRKQPILGKTVPMSPFETIEINEMRTACDGGGGPLGHPKVYLSLAPAGRVECPYCSRLFVNRAALGAGHATAPGSGDAGGAAHG
jgi:uncharacterized Zn-finger protein